ncbi:MAG: glutathione S-transferase family protein [Candidatus Marinimicrobia bacterium]|nr:glutathione S-transferase family protein [Candidatus Neomarinimicrobiota bacterium]MBT7043573.1 glutathione S-transferase family protein [Candidatus Neomarinimicrobiota bacterium]
MGTKGEFVRQASIFRNWVTASGESGYLAEPDRYHLYVSLACPWAHRTVIFRKLKKLDDVISLSLVDPIRDHRGWCFTGSEGEFPDEINGFSFLSEAYLKSDPSFDGRVTVAALWDKKTQRIVNNESSEIIRMLNTEFNAFTESTMDYYPEELRVEIDEINAFVYANINNGVYRAGFATTQTAYEKAFTTLFLALDNLEERLSGQSYLVGNQITEADWRLFTTLVRFDPVYYGHFKCNQKRLVDYPHLWRYTRNLYQVPGVADTVNMDHIKRHYYETHASLNPTGIVPKGPEIDFTIRET